MASVKGYFLPPIRRKLYAHGKLPRWLEKFSTGCTLSTGFLWLLVTDFFVHWQSGFLCSTLRHRFARSVPMVLGTDQHRRFANEDRSPNWLPRLSVHHVCVGLPRKSVHILGSRFCIPCQFISVLLFSDELFYLLFGEWDERQCFGPSLTKIR